MKKIDRQPLSKKIRFDVFKRDNFCCQYCGQTPPAIVLEIDHIRPVSRGGKNDIDNLVASCFDCNRGKSDKLLTVIPKSIEEKAALLQEKQDQLKAFEKLQKSKRRFEEKQIDQVEEVFQEYYPDRYFTPKFRTSIRKFVQRMPSHLIIDAMHMACARMSNNIDATKYFCGICWRTIKEAEGG
jgi:5-methylcytosine-specific restriction endonuclease McrA